jgi:hypothetical protein
MSARLTDRLADIDPDKLRSAPEEMKVALAAVVGADSDLWTGGWHDVAPALSAVARLDLCLARLVEGHADACRILNQAGSSGRDGVYGVWASRSVGTGLKASETGAGWSLSGQLRFASGIDLIDRVLVPGWVDSAHHLLFDVAVAAFKPDRTSWGTAAMDASRSFTCWCDDLDAGTPIGETDFYLSRPGFAIGGIGPAAVWLGGAQQVAELVTEGLSRFAASPHQARRLGVVEHAVWRAGAALDHVIGVLDVGDREGGGRAVSHGRTAVVAACDTALREAPLIVGPGGLSTNARLARVIADLGIYIRQHHVDSSMQAYGDAALARHRARSE